jgi:hypothetical protein
MPAHQGAQPGNVGWPGPRDYHHDGAVPKPPPEKVTAMNARYRTYTAYSIGVGIVWAVLLVLASIFDPASRRNDIFWVGAGFAIGWLSATIARFV